RVVQSHAKACFAQPGRTMRWEARKIRKDGTMLWARETVNAVLLKKRPVLLVVCEDITERKRAEQALMRSEAYLAESQRLTHTGSWAYNPVTRRIVYWSEELFRIYGLDPRRSSLPEHDELQRMRYPAELDIEEIIVKATREKSDFESELRIALPGGTVRH